MNQLSTNHRNLLHLTEIQPPTERGVALKRTVSLFLLRILINQFLSTEDEDRKKTAKQTEFYVDDVPDSVKVQLYPLYACIVAES